ncbi:MAG: hypothetical protein LAN83_09820 [Acidobacteriia bacterium]|nr:hypothetical protein [Terriglobia bacterium]
MTAHKRTEITVESDQFFIIRRRRTVRVWCQECGCEVDTVGLGEAEEFNGVPGLMLRAGAQAREWHFSEGQDGTRLICLESLLKSK